MQNTLFTNDNLFILNGLNSEIADLIYLDPPFNSKRTYSAPIGSKSAGASFKDMWTWQDVNEAYLDKLIEKHPALVDFINSIEATQVVAQPQKGSRTRSPSLLLAFIILCKSARGFCVG